MSLYIARHLRCVSIWNWAIMLLNKAISARLRSHLFAHYAQNYAGIIRQGLGRSSWDGLGNTVSFHRKTATYGKTTTTQTDRLLPGQYFLYLFGLDLQSRCLIYSPPPVPVTLQHRRWIIYTEKRGLATHKVYVQWRHVHSRYGLAPAWGWAQFEVSR